MAVVSLATSVLYLLKHDKYVEALKILVGVDQKFEYLGIKLLNKYVFIVTTIYASFFWGPFAAALQSERPILIKILDILGYGIPIIMRFTGVYTYIFVIMIVAQRFQTFNHFLSSDDSKNQMGAHVLDLLMDVYKDLVNVLNMTTTGFEQILLLNIIGNYVQFVFGLYYLVIGVSGELSMFENHFTTLGLTIQMSIIYFLCFKIKKMVRRMETLPN